MIKKTLQILLAGCLVTLALATWLYYERSPKSKIESSQSIQTQTQDLSSNVFRLRYDKSRDPKSSPEAARDYYARGRSLIREFYGSHVLDKPLHILKATKASRSDLLSAMSDVRRHEIIEGIPLAAALLTSSDPSVVRSSVELLCWFRDKRGFEFVMSKMEGPDSEKWWGIFEKDFISQSPTEYLPRIKGLLKSKANSRVEVYVVARALAQLGDSDAAKYLLPVIEREPHMSIDTILMLSNVRDPSVTALMRKLSSEGSTLTVRQAADFVQAKQGDNAAQRRLLESAKLVTGLPQPENPDGSDKPGMKPKVFGEVTPAWDGNAVFALEHGIETVPHEQAVPVLRDIATRADNIRFSRTAIELLAKIGNEAARNALWEVARSVQARKRTYEDTLFTTTGKALMPFDDTTSKSLATVMFSGDKHGMEVSSFLAETRGWEGLFKLDLLY